MFDVVLAIDGTVARSIEQAETVDDLVRGKADARVTVFHDFTDNPEAASVTQLGSIDVITERLKGAGAEAVLEEASGDL